MIPFFQQAFMSVGVNWSTQGLSQNSGQPLTYCLLFASLVAGITVLALKNRQLHRTIQKSQQTERSLRASESHYRALMRALPDLMMRVDKNGIYLEFLASPNFRVLGNMPPDWVGIHVAENLPSNLAKQRLDAIEIALETQAVQVYEQTVCLDDQTLQMEQVRVVPYSQTEVLILVQDISDRKRAENSLQASEQRFRRAISMAPLPIMLYAEDGEVLCINDTWTKISGYAPSDLPTVQRWAQLAYGERAYDIIENLIAKKYISQPYQDEGDFEITTSQGTQRIWEFRTAPLEKLADGRQVLISMAVDVTQHRQAVMALSNSEERYRSVYTQAAVGLASGTFNGKLLDVNPHFCEMLGYARSELISKSIQEITHPDDWVASKTLIENLVNAETPHALHEKRYLKQDGSFLWCSTGLSVVKDTYGQPQYALAVVRDISDRIKAETQLKHDAFHDALTGLPNRSLLMQRLELALKRTKRHPKTYLAILFIDLDNFKVINDSLGHLVGDELLLAISNQLKVIIRETDVAARLGGDEFIVLLEDINALSEATMVADRILEMLQTPFTIANRELFPSASIGIVTSDSNPNRQAADLLRDADVAMYWAKSNGRKQYAIFDPAMHLQAVHRLKIENYLRKAIENQEFQLYYQPIINLKTLTIAGFETLLRWQHPERGLLIPHQFLTVAKNIGLILPISDWVLGTACQQLAQWQATFPTKSLNVHVNLSEQSLDHSLLSRLEDLLTQHQLQGHNVILEMTEKTLLKTLETSQNLLTRIKHNNIHLAIDDFGTGYACLRYLSQLPISTLKIDRSFVSPPEFDTRGQAIAESMINLCHTLGLQAIAEGIETPNQLTWLRELGCPLGQGYHFAHPLPAEKATELLAQETR